MSLSRFDFPQGFLFGAATAAYQIEGSAFGGCGPCHWDTFAATPGNVARAETGATACDHYHRWEADLDLMQAANLDAYRFSTSWARVMPDGVTANPEGFDFYDRLVDGMLARGLRPFQTLYHWELPSALADRGGWANRDTAARFADYAEAITRRLGDRVASIATINEPWRGFMPPACAISARRHGRCTMSCWRTGWRWTACAGWVRATLASS